MPILPLRLSNLLFSLQELQLGAGIDELVLIAISMDSILIGDIDTGLSMLILVRYIDWIGDIDTGLSILIGLGILTLLAGVTFMEISSSWFASDISFLVHLLNLLLIVQLSLEPDQLHGVGQDVLVQETLRLEVYVLGDLEAIQSLFPASAVQLLEHTGSEVSVPDDLLI